MFGRKKREIKRLNNLLHLKETERRLEHVKAIEAEKQLTVLLNKVSEARNRLTVLMNENAAQKKRAAWFEREMIESSEAEEKASIKIAELEKELKRRAQLYEHGKQVMAARLRDMKAQLRDMKEEVIVYQNNVSALSFNIEQANQAYIALAQAHSGLCGKLEVYERIVGKVESGQETEKKENDN